MDGNIHNVKVLLRIRPAQDTETFNIRFGEKKWCKNVDEEIVTSISIPVDSGEKIFNFEGVYSTQSTQHDVYRGITNSVLSTVQGFNATVFTFGATASGKTHSMCGSEEDFGIMHRATADIFQAVETQRMQKRSTTFNIELSLVELYNNQFRNLLRADHSNSTYRSNNLSSDINSAADSAHSDASVVPYPTFSGRIGSFADKIELHESPVTGVFLVGHPNIRLPVKTIEDAHSLISRGLSGRKIGTTAYNMTSSRSHTILTVHVESVETFDGDFEKIMNSKSEVRLGRLHLIDLAGERLSSLRSEETSSPVETQYINLSILALGEVLQKLTTNAMSTNRFVASKSKNKSSNQNSLRGRLFWDSPPRGRSSFGGDAEAPKMAHVPYYDSKLTHLLKDSLGGNCQTTMLTHISPVLEDYHKTLNTLLFCSRVSTIMNSLRINKVQVGAGEFLNIKSESSLIRSLKAQYMREFELSVITSTKLSKIAAVVSKSKRTSLGGGVSRSRPSTPQGESSGLRSTTNATTVFKTEMETSLARMNEMESLLNFKCSSLEEKLVDMEFQVNAIKNFRKLYHEKNIKDIDHEKKGLESLVAVIQKSESVLRENLETVNKNYMKLQSDYQQLSEAHRRGVDIVGSTELQFNSLRSDYESLHEDYTKQSNELQYCSQQLSIKESEAKSMEIELTGVRSELLFQLSINERQQTELNLTKEEVVRCKQNLDDQRLKLHAMKEEAAMFSANNTQQINDLTSETASLKADIVALQISLQYANENCTNTKSHAEILLAARTELEGELGGLQASIDGYEQKSTALKQELVRAMDQVGSLTAENSSLKHDSSLLRQQISNLKSESTELKSELDRVTNGLGKKTSQCSELLDENKNLLDKLRISDSKDSENRLQLQQTLQRLTADIESKNSELEVLAINFRESERKCNYLLDNKTNIEAAFERELDAMRLQLKEKSEEATVLESELRTLRFTLSSLQGEYSAAQRKVGQFQGMQSEAVQIERQLRDEIAKLGKQLRQSVDSKNELLERTKRETEAAHHAASVKNEEIDSLGSELDIVRSEILSVKDELEEVKQELQQRLSEMMEMSEVENSLRNENSHLREILAAKDRLVESSERKLITLQQSNCEQPTDVSYLRNNLSLSLADLETATSEAERLRSEKGELELQVKRLEVYSRELSSAKEGDRREIEENKKKILSMNDELVTLRNTIASLQYDLQKNEKHFANDRDAIKSMQTSLEESNSKLSARVKELIKTKAVEDDRYNQELSTLQKGLAERLGDVSALTAELELCRSTLSVVRGDCSKAQEELMQRAEELAASTMECSALRDKLSHIQENDQENSLLYQRINEMGSTLLSTEKELVMCKAKLSNQQSESRSLTAQLDRVTAELQDYRDRVAHLAGSVDALQREKDAALVQIAASRKETERLQQDQVSYLSNLERQRAEIAGLTSRIADIYRQHLSDNENAKREASSLKRERDEALSRVRMIEEAMQLATDNSRETDRYNKELATLKQALLEKSGQADIYLEQVQKLRVDLDLLGESKIRALCESEKRFLAERQSNREQQSAMEEVLQSLESVKQNTAALNEQLQGEIKNLKVDLSAQSKLLVQKQGELALAEETTEKYRRQLQETGGTISAELQLLKAETSKCKTLLAEKSSEIVSLREERTQLLGYREDYLRQKSKESERAGSEIQTLKNLLVTRSSDIENLSKENEELSQRIVDCSSSVDKLQNELLVTKQLLKNKTLAFDNSVEENEELRSKLSEFCSREERTVEKIRKDLAASRQAFDEKNEDASRLARENLALLDKLSLSSDMKSAELSTAQQEVATLKATLADMISKNSFLESEFKRVESKFNQMVAVSQKDYEDHLLALKQAHLSSNDKDKEVAILAEQLSLLTEQETDRAKFVEGLQDSLEKAIVKQFETENQSKMAIEEATRISIMLEQQLTLLRQENSKLSIDRDILSADIQTISKERVSLENQIVSLQESSAEEIAHLTAAFSNVENSMKDTDMKWKLAEEKFQNICLTLEEENQNKSLFIQQKMELEEEINILWTCILDNTTAAKSLDAQTPKDKIISTRDQFLLLWQESNDLRKVNDVNSEQLRVAMEAHSAISVQLVGVESNSESSEIDSLNVQFFSPQNMERTDRQSGKVAMVDIEFFPVCTAAAAEEEQKTKDSEWTAIILQLDRLKSQKADLESSIARSEERLTDLTQREYLQGCKIRALEEEAAKLSVDIQDRDGNIEHLHAEITKLSVSLANSVAEGEALKEQHFIEIESLKEETKNELLGRERAFDALQRALDTTKDELGLLESEFKKLQDAKQEADANVIELKSELSKAQMTAEKLMLLENKYQALQNQSIKEKESINADLTNQREENGQLSESLAEYSLLRNNLEQELKASQEKFEDQVLSLTNRLLTVSESERVLQLQLQQLQDEILDKEKDSELKILSVIQAKEEAIALLRESLEHELKASGEKFEEQLRSLSDKLVSVSESERVLQLQSQQLQDEMRDKENNFGAEMIAVIQAKGEAIALLQNDLLNSQQDVDTATRRMAELRQACNEEKLQLSQKYDSEISAIKLSCAQELIMLTSTHDEAVAKLKTTLDKESLSFLAFKREIESAQAASQNVLQQQERDIAHLTEELSTLNHQLSESHRSLSTSQEAVELLNTEIREKEIIFNLREANLTSELQLLTESASQRELELMDQVASLENKEREAMVALRKVTDELGEWKVDCDGLKEQLAQNLEIFEKMRKENSECSRVLVLKTSLVEVLESSVEHLTSELDSLRERNVSLESDIRESRNAAADTESKLDTLTISHEELSLSIQKLSAEHSRILVAHGQETRSLQAAVYAKSEELAHLKSEKKAFLQEKVTILSQCDSLNGEIISLQRELAIAHSVRVELAEKLEETSSECEKVRDDSLTLSGAFKAKDMESRNQAEEIARLESTIIQLKHDLTSLDNALKLKSGEALLHEEQSSQLREQKSYLEENLSALSLIADSLRQELSELRLNSVEKDLFASTLQSQIEMLQVTLSEREKVIDAIRVDLDSASHDREEMHSNLAEVNRRLVASCKRLKELDEELISTRLATATQLQTAADLIAESKKDLLDMSKSVDSLRDVCNGRIVQLQKSFLLRENELRQELQDKAAYSTTLEEKIRKQEEKHSEESKLLLRQLEESRASYEQLSEATATQLQTAADLITESKKDLLDMSISVDSLRDDCNGRIVQLQKSFLLRENELRQELQDKAAYSSALEEKIRNQEEKHSEESKRFLSQLEESRASYEQLNEVLKASEEDRSALAAKSHALQDLITESKKDLLDMSKSVDSLRDDCNGRIVQLQKSFLLRENELRQELQDKAAYSTTLEEKIRKQEEKHSEESDSLLSQLEESRASYEQLSKVTATQLQTAADLITESKKDLLVMSISVDSLRDDCNGRIVQLQKSFLLRENELRQELQDKIVYSTTLEEKIRFQDEKHSKESDRLLTKLKESSESYERMKEDFSASEKGRSTLTADRDALENRLTANQKHFEDSVAAMKRDHSSKLINLQAECDGLQNQVTTLRLQFSNADAKHEKEKLDMSSLLQEKEQESISALVELNTLRRQSLQLSSELDDFKVRLSIATEGSAELKSKVAQLTTELKTSLTLTERLRQENEGLVANHATEMSDSQRKLEDMRLQLNDRSSELEQHSSQITELMHVLGMHTAELQTVCTENNSLQDRLHSAMEQIERLQRDLVFLNQVCNSRGNELGDMSKELEALRYQRSEEASRFSESISQLKQQFELRTTEWHTAKEELEKLRRKGEEMTRERAREEERGRQVSAKLQLSSQQLQSAEAELLQARQRLRDNEAEFSEATHRVEEITNLLTIKAAEAEDMTNFEIKLLIHLIKNRKKLTLVLNNNGPNNSSGNKSFVNTSSTKFS